MTQRRVQGPEPVRVLQSFTGPGPQTNPYIIQLHESLGGTPGVARRAFSWRAALLGRFDVFHAHWPEALIARRGWLSTFGRRTLYALFLLRLSVQRIPIVRTVHNVGLPDGISGSEWWLLEWTERLTRVRVILNEFTPVPPHALAVRIDHGHYRDWFAAFPTSTRVPGRILFFGKIRRYKNVTGLVAAFRNLPNTEFSLHIAGSPSTSALTAALRDAAGSDPRISLRLEFVPDPDLVLEASAAELVVLPYPEMHNSGSVLAALSLGRPVLVPNNDFNRQLAAEVGEDWVLMFDGPLTADHLAWGLTRAAALTGRPNLARRGWTDAGLQHLTAYRLALRGRGQRRER